MDDLENLLKNIAPRDDGREVLARFRSAAGGARANTTPASSAYPAWFLAVASVAACILVLLPLYLPKSAPDSRFASEEYDAPAATPATESLMFRGNHRRTGHFPGAVGTGMATLFQIANIQERAVLFALNAETGDELWKKTLDATTRSSPVPARGKVYIGTQSGALYALDSKNGNIRWRAETGDAIHSTPAVAGKFLVVGSHDKNVHCFHADTGEKIWSRATGGKIWSSPAVADGRVFIGSHDRVFYALDLKTGKPVWTFQAEGGFYSSPAVHEDVVYVGCDDSRLYALRTPDGAKLWATDFNVKNTIFRGSPAVDTGNQLLVRAPDDRIHFIDTGNGESTWNSGKSESFYAPCIIPGREWFLWDGMDKNNRPLLMLLTTNRKFIDSLPVSCHPDASPACTQDRLFLVCKDGFLRAFSLYDKSLLWEKNLGGLPDSSPALAD